jgi:hypothetical protein
MSRGAADRVVAGAAGLMLAATMLVALEVSGLMAGAAPAPAASGGCTPSAVCATSGHRPDPAAASTPGTARNVGQVVTLTNGGPNKLSQVEFHQPVPVGFAFVKDALGACTFASGAVICRHDHVDSGQTVTNTLIYRTPVLPSGTQQTTAFVGTWCWAGCQAHNPGAARVDSIDLSEDTIVQNVPGFDATYLLAGTSAALVTGTGTSSADPLAGTWTVPGQPGDLAVTATEKPNPSGFPSCPSDGLPCRSGDWFAALSPGTLSFKPFTTVTYLVDKSLIPAGLSPDDYQVAYTPCLPGDDPANPKGCPVERLARCTSAVEPRCTESVDKLAGDVFRVVVRIGSHNGYMR